MTVKVTRTDLDAAGLRLAAGRSKDADAARRMLALALVQEGLRRADAARAAGMDRQTLRDWVHRYNAEGLAGLSRRHGGGATAKLTGAQEAEVASWVRSGPDREADGIVRWRCVDLRDRIAERFDVTLHERSVGKLLARLGFAHVSGRPRHPRGNQQAQASFRATSPPS